MNIFEFRVRVNAQHPDDNAGAGGIGVNGERRVGHGDNGLGFPGTFTETRFDADGTRGPDAADAPTSIENERFPAPMNTTYF